MFSPKRQNVLENIIKQAAPAGQRKPLLDLCKTRWAERAAAYDHFYDAYVFIVETLEYIAHGMHGDTYSMEDEWNTKTRSEAASLCTGITNFRFVCVFMLVYQGLGALGGISVSLQKKAIDVYDAYSKVCETKK